jgi:hypothetical protein
MGEQASVEQLHFFENEIRPLLVKRCQACHGAEKQSGGLRLDSGQAALAGGDSGAAIVPGKPAESLLIEAINYQSLEMPPEAKLPPKEIELLTRWVSGGAAWTPSNVPGAVTVREQKQITAADRATWAFQKPLRPELPTVQQADWMKTPVDAFILAKLEAAGLTPAKQAEKRTLIRRATFDLLGLPPTPEEVAAFENDRSADAYPRLIDRLLARPEYGERWGRHWLDLVRYAETNGYERDDDKPQAWRYRDYVIRAFNEDKPYDRFVLEQLAGDELQPRTDEAITATAFYRLGVWDDEPDDTRQAIFDGLDDMLSTTGSTFLGLTIGCARCHDHKFDPLLQEDYYSLLAFMRNVTYYGNPKNDNNGGTSAARGILQKLSTGEQTLAVSEAGVEVPPTHILIRGDAGTPGREVSPRFVQVLCQNDKAAQPKFSAVPPDSPSSHRRLILAKWIASAENPLTARVMVNRLWQHHFGRGIVATPSDFGATGEAPTHPKLLDWLATELVAGGWKLKRMHRLLMLSNVYRQASQGNRQAAAGVDADNRLWWHYPLRRLEAEAIRDAILAVSGELKTRLGGPSIYPTLSPGVLATQSRPGSGWHTSPPEEQGRRSVYIVVKRTLGVPLLDSFDFATPDQPIARRATTTIAPQALILLNGRFMEEQSRAFAARLLKEAPDSRESRITRAFALALGRAPASDEMRLSLGHIEQQQAAFEALQAGETAELQSDAKAETANVQHTPLQGWTAFEGTWSLRADGGYEVQPAAGAKSIWNEPELTDGTITAQVLLRDKTGDAGILARVADPQVGVDTLQAYNINFRHDGLRLGKHRNNWQELTGVRCELALDTWHDVRIELAGPAVKVYLNGETEPRLSYVDPQPLPAGKIGFRTFQVGSALRKLTVRSGEKQWVARFVPACEKSVGKKLPPAEQHALESFCKLILNLNEFVYID